MCVINTKIKNHYYIQALREHHPIGKIPIARLKTEDETDRLYGIWRYS